MERDDIQNKSDIERDMVISTNGDVHLNFSFGEVVESKWDECGIYSNDVYKWQHMNRPQEFMNVLVFQREIFNDRSGICQQIPDYQRLEKENEI